MRIYNVDSVRLQWCLKFQKGSKINFISMLCLSLSNLRKGKFKHHFLNTFNPLCRSGNEVDPASCFLRCRNFSQKGNLFLCIELILRQRNIVSFSFLKYWFLTKGKMQQFFGRCPSEVNFKNHLIKFSSDDYHFWGAQFIWSTTTLTANFLLEITNTWVKINNHLFTC